MRLDPYLGSYYFIRGSDPYLGSYYFKWGSGVCRSEAPTRRGALQLRGREYASRHLVAAEMPPQRPACLFLQRRLSTGVAFFNPRARVPPICALGRLLMN